MAYYNRGNYQVQRYGSGDKLAVQIATRQNRRSGGQTALTANISKVEDGVSVTLSNQMWFGLAASLGLTAISALRNPLTLINRIDDIAQDVESLQMEEDTWEVINQTARQHGTGKHSQNVSAARSALLPHCQPHCFRALPGMRSSPWRGPALHLSALRFRGQPERKDLSELPSTPYLSVGRKILLFNPGNLRRGEFMIKIIADTTCGLPLDILKQAGIEVLPQIITFGNETFRDDTEMNTGRFLEKLRASRTSREPPRPLPHFTLPSTNKSSRLVTPLW